jgi:hypothetical protein
MIEMPQSPDRLGGNSEPCRQRFTAFSIYEDGPGHRVIALPLASLGIDDKVADTRTKENIMD